jgi:hypothetical protein
VRNETQFIAGGKAIFFSKVPRLRPLILLARKVKRLDWLESEGPVFLDSSTASLLPLAGQRVLETRILLNA